MQDAQGITPGSEGGPHHKRPRGPGTDRQRPRGDGSGGITTQCRQLPNPSVWGAWQHKNVSSSPRERGQHLLLQRHGESS